jgi:hypothetical protein
MKKNYIQPSVSMDKMGIQVILAGSPGVTSNKGIGYGGVDVDGIKDPASRQWDMWDDEDDE